MSGGDLDLAPVIVWASALALLLSLGTTIWNLLNSGAKRNALRLDNHSTRLTEHDHRIAAIEQTLRGVPGQTDFHALQLSLSEMRGDLREMRAIMGRMETIVTRHEDHLLEGKR